MSVGEIATIQRNSVRRCTVLSADGTETTVRTVYCPRRARSETFERCCGCTHMRSVDVEGDGEHGSVDCAVTGPIEIRVRPRGEAPVDVREAAAHTTLSSVMTSDVHCVRADVPIARAADAMSVQNLPALPVVDDERRLVGILSRADLLRTAKRAGDGAPAIVSDVMTPLVHGVPEDAPLAYAISLMAFEALNELPAVAHDGRVVGVLSAVDALRWVARSLGYAVPTGTDKHTHAR